VAAPIGYWRMAIGFSMRILISNDDGILAPGLAALYAAMADLGEVTVVAPESPQSAAGHSITLQHPLVVRRLRVGSGAEAFEGISVDGRPADCVRLAIKNLLSAPPDLVLSGINAGANVGINVFYSGTVAAAAEAAMFGIPAVAFSAGQRENEPIPASDYGPVAKCCRQVLDRLLASGLTRGDLMNVNIPPLGGGRPAGVHVVRQATSGVEDTYLPVGDPAGRELYRLSDKFHYQPSERDTDVKWLADHCITVTPLHVDMTNHDRLSGLQKMSWEL